MAHPLAQGAFRYRNVQIFKSQPLGIGAYGAVYRGKCDELPCAAKVLHPILCQSKEPGEQRAQERFEQECVVLREIQHPHIIQYLRTYVDPDTGLLVLLMEMMEESLTQFLERSSEPLPYRVEVTLAHDIALAIAFLHASGVIHRDLSANNILLCGGRAKVTDFGMAKLKDMAPSITPTKCPGTPNYMPPEALQDHPSYSETIDCFSMGVLDIHIMTRCYPAPGPRWYVVEDARSPTGNIHIPILEAERRENHISLIDTSHPLLPVALDCIKDKSKDRPSAAEVCTRLDALKEVPSFTESLDRSWTQINSTSTEAVADLQREREGEERSRENTLLLEREVCQLREKVKREEEKLQAAVSAIEERDAKIATALQESETLRQQLQTLEISSTENEQDSAHLSSKLQNLTKLLHVKDQAIRQSIAVEKESRAIIEAQQEEIAGLTERLEHVQLELKERDTAFGSLQNETENLQSQVKELHLAREREHSAAEMSERELQWRLKEAVEQAGEKGRQLGQLQTHFQLLQVKLAEEERNCREQVSLLNRKQQEMLQELQFYHSQLQEKESCIQAHDRALERMEREMVVLREKMGEERDAKRMEEGGKPDREYKEESDKGGGGEKGKEEEEEGRRRGGNLTPLKFQEKSKHSISPDQSPHHSASSGSSASPDIRGSLSSEDEEGENTTRSSSSWALIDESFKIPSLSLANSSRCFSAPSEMSRGTLAMNGYAVYFRAESWRSNYQAFSMYKNAWFPVAWHELPLSGCSLVMVDGKLTTVGGYDQWHLNEPTNILLSRSEEGEVRGWGEIFPPMLTRRYWTTAMSSEKHLIVAGGHDGKQELSTVEVLDVESSRWHAVSSLPVSLTNASGVVCRGQLHLAGGLSNNQMTKTVLTCSLTDLLAHSSLRGRIKKAFSPSVTRKNIWKKFCLPDLPVYQTTLVAAQGHLLAVGGCDYLHVPTDAIFLFHPDSFSWEVCGRMKSPRRLCFAVALPNNCLMVAGGYTSTSLETALVEMIHIT